MVKLSVRSKDTYIKDKLQAVPNRNSNKHHLLQVTKLAGHNCQMLVAHIELALAELIDQYLQQPKSSSSLLVYQYQLWMPSSLPSNLACSDEDEDSFIWCQNLNRVLAATVSCIMMGAEIYTLTFPAYEGALHTILGL